MLVRSAVKDATNLSENMLTKKLAEHLPQNDVERAVMMLRDCLLRLKPVKLQGKGKGKLEWTLPPPQTRPLPVLLPRPAKASLLALPHMPRTRLIPLKCWTLAGLDFKAAEDAPAYNPSKHSFFIGACARLVASSDSLHFVATQMSSTRRARPSRSRRKARRGPGALPTAAPVVCAV